MIYEDYINHNSYAMSLKHYKLPLIAQTELDFFRYVTFTNDMYGKTISELHHGNLRAVTKSNRYSTLFEGEKVSYWAATSSIARRERLRHNQGKASHLVFWAYDDISNTFPMMREPMIIIDGIQLGFEKILEKCDRGEPLTAQDQFLIDKIKEKNPDCLAYKPHTSKNIHCDKLPSANEANFMFFEKGFNKLVLREVNLRVNHNKNRNDIYCSVGGGYTLDEESYGKYFAPIAKVKMNSDYLKSDEYLLRKAMCEEIAKGKYGGK